MSDLSKLQAGDQHYKAYVGPPLKYDLLGALQFTLLTAAGLRAKHKLVDIGCGSLRAGKLLIPYLDKGNYYGLDPNRWLIDEGIEKEVGQSLIDLKSPTFSESDNFQLAAFNTSFDYAIAQSIFSHASGEQIISCLKEVGANLNAEGLFLATFIWGTEDYQGSEWVYPGCVSFTQETIAKWAWNEAGLKMEATNWPHPNGQNWALFYKEGMENKVKALAKFNMQHFKADTIAIPEEHGSGYSQKIKRILKRLIK
ncbi:MAG: class I SAM-dependent methyltransferase [Bacteroidetes bacterium]|nr:class I SAM-dependent methyltransferase [Bacteroidota bacterium]